jgi:hypothetical protein
VSSTVSGRKRKEEAMSRFLDKWRSIVVLATLAAAAACLGALTAPAQAEGVTPAQLAARGWTCFQPPIVPARISCLNPGLGRPPVPPDPDGKPSYMFLAFEVDGTFIGTGHLIRVDLYVGEPCGPSGEPYVLRALIGYYECLHP